MPCPRPRFPHLDTAEGDWLAVADFAEEDPANLSCLSVVACSDPGPDPFLPDSKIVGVEGTSKDLVAEAVDGATATGGEASAQAITPISLPPPCRD